MEERLLNKNEDGLTWYEMAINKNDNELINLFTNSHNSEVSLLTGSDDLKKTRFETKKVNHKTSKVHPDVSILTI